MSQTNKLKQFLENDDNRELTGVWLNRGNTHYQNLRDLRIAMHSEKFDSASQILDICQACAYADGTTNELVRPIAHSAAKQMLYHLQAMYQLKLDSIEFASQFQAGEKQ